MPLLRNQSQNCMIAHFVPDWPETAPYSGDSGFAQDKPAVYSDSVGQIFILTKIFI